MNKHKQPKPAITSSHSVFKSKGFLFFALCLLATMAGIYFVMQSAKVAPPTVVQTQPKFAPSKAPEPAHYVGAESCQPCHQNEFAAWRGSHHDLAMQEANAQTVLGDFNNAKFKHNGVESTFFKRDGKFMVQTEGADGKLTDYSISYTFGVTPLQQYLIAFPKGRYQALNIAWDSRPKTEGGQRWFALYPKEKFTHNDQMHWTGRYQNWNMQCAECHSTNLKKGYDAETDSYQTTFKELNVACEACHGAASQHIDWAKNAKPPYNDNNKGLSVKLHSDWQQAWQFSDSHSKIAQRQQPANDALMNTCWACHARRLTLVEGGAVGLPLEDTHRPALLNQPTYYADGQQQDEDYTWGSFRQSKMFQKGVVCMDCHEPHSIKLRAEGNALCTRCHNPADFDTEKHHKHKQDSKGAVCMDCHAPEQNYMVIDGRHDHSFRLPRPDLSQSLGSPNACTQCHSKQKPEWAASAMDKWYGKNWRERPHYGTTLAAGTTQGLKALPKLLELAQDTGSPALVRATALNLIAPMMQPELLMTIRTQLKDADPSVRIAALGVMESVDPVNRVLSAAPLLSDSIRGVRIEAARILADIPENQFPASQINARLTAFKEYQDVLKSNADWATENMNQGNLMLRQGNTEAAITAYQRAISLDPLLSGAYVNLADIYRRLGRDDEGEKQLRKGLALLPKAADLHHALGLLLVRKTDKVTALQELAVACKLAPDNIRYAYVYGVALNSVGKQHEALQVLKAADARQAYNLDVLSALISMTREAGDTKAALVYAQKAAEVLPDNGEIKQLITELKKGQ